MITYQLSDMMNELGYENVDNICMKRKEERDRLGWHSYDCNLRSVSKVMDFGSGRLDHFTSTCLIIADRLYEYGVGLAYFLQFNTCANVLSVVNEYKSDCCIEQDIDFVIFCGYQKNKTNYQIIETMRKRQNPPHIIMVAHLDTFISEICREFNITHTYDRNYCLSEFINYLSTVQRCPKIRIAEEKEQTYEKKDNKPMYRAGFRDAFLNILQHGRRSTAKNL